MKDLLLNDNNDLLLHTGDFTIGESKMQQQRLVLQSHKGEWKQHPLVGVGVESFLEDEEVEELFAEIREQFKIDGHIIKSLELNNMGKIIVKAS